MADDVIARLLRGQYPDPDGGANLDARVRSVVIDDSLSGCEDELVDALDLGDHFAVVTDAGTHGVLGARVERALAARCSVTAVSLGDDAHPDERAVEAVVARAQGAADALVAVGTGTVNDVAKAAAARLGRPYVVFPTALSVNGYASGTASIISADGFKHSLPAAPPVGVFMDLSVLARAPARLTLSGLGESLNRCTAQADWLLSHLVHGTPYRSAPFALIRTQEDELYARADALAAGDLESLAVLARSLVLAGMGMTIAGGSVSSSQGEHLISHYVDLMRPRGVRPAYHGEQIGVTTVLMAGLQQRVLASERPPVLRASTSTRAELTAHFGARNGRAAWAELEPKLLTAAGAAELGAAIAARWDAIRGQLAAVVRPAEQLRAVLERAGAPARPAELGWADDFTRAACERARQLRSRYTFLDLAADAGVSLVA